MAGPSDEGNPPTSIAYHMPIPLESSAAMDYRSVGWSSDIGCSMLTLSGRASFSYIEVKYLILFTLKLSVGLFFCVRVLNFKVTNKFVTLKLSTLTHGNELRNN